MTDCYCDYDLPEFSRMVVRKASKPHVCGECNGKILYGDKYENVAGVWDRQFSRFKTCMGCMNIRQWAEDNLVCVCWAHGRMIEDCYDAVKECAPTDGVYFGFLRMIVRRNNTRQGQGG